MASYFDPNAPLSSEDGLFGLATRPDEARVQLIPVPWEVTVSYGRGTSQAPQSIRKASTQLDLYDLDLGRIYEHGLYMEPLPQNLLKLNEQAIPWAKELIQSFDSSEVDTSQIQRLTKKINESTQEMVTWVESRVDSAWSDGKIPGVIGGDHSVALGAIQVAGQRTEGDFGILQIDAHADLRHQYQGLIHSHASVFNNVMHGPYPPRALTQVGIRDFCEEELQVAQKMEGQIQIFFDRDLKRKLFRGEPWYNLCLQIIENLPSNVYISFDIDGLSPDHCPHTGTPVPGGLSFDQAVYLISQVAKSDRKIIGFDLCEVSPSPNPQKEWDANVGARLLYALCGWTLYSQGYKPKALL